MPTNKWHEADQSHRWASRMTLKPFAIGLIVAGSLLRGGAFAEDAGLLQAGSST